MLRTSSSVTEYLKDSVLGLYNNKAKHAQLIMSMWQKLITYLSELQSVGVQSLKRKCQVDVMNLLIQIRLFPICMHSFLQFKLKFSRGGIRGFETICRTRLSTSFWALWVFEDVWRLVWREKPGSHFLPHRLTPVQLTERINFDFISNDKGLFVLLWSAFLSHGNLYGFI